jgi:hypothetical protein
MGDWKLAIYGNMCNEGGNGIYISGNGADAVHHPKDSSHVDDRRNISRT